MLKTNNLTCGYHNVPVLENINVEIQAGTIFSLIGLNGSGKSTFLKTLLGLLPPLSGSVSVNGLILSEISVNEKIGLMTMLEAEPSAHFYITAEELFRIRRHIADTKLIDKSIAAFEIEKFFGKNILELSAGQAKRVWLAHLFSLGSKVIIIDEPFAHLDWSQQKNLCEILKDWKKEFNTTFVIAAHELELVANLADQIAVVAKNKFLSVGGAESVLTSSEVAELFAFQARIDENPLDGSKRLTLGQKK